MGVEEFKRFLDRQFKNLRDIAARVLNIECFAVESAAATGFTAHESRREKVHLQLDRTGAFAFGAAPLRAVERETARSVAAQARLRCLSEELANIIEEPDVCRGRGTGRTANWRLVHFIHRLDGFEPRKIFVLAR